MDNYIVTSDGEIYSLLKNKILSGYVNKDGYLVVDLQGIKHLMHRIVAECFIQNENNKPYVNHKDGNKLNNSLDNLEWCTPSENTNHALKSGFIKCTKIIQLSLDGKFIKEYDSMQEASKQTGIKQGNISLCCSNFRKKAGGFTWKKV